jgi:hypothetical protein
LIPGQVDLGAALSQHQGVTRLGLILGLCGLWASACRGDAVSDDPADYNIDPSRPYVLEVKEPRFVVHSPTLPAKVGYEPSNNNVDIVFHEDRLFMAWRQGPTHFAGPDVKMQVVSSLNQGESWDWEATIALGSDVREPRLLSMNGRVWLYFFQGGDQATSFDPRHLWRIERRDLANWTAPERGGRDGEVPWDLKVRNGLAYLTSYAGNHYGTGDSAIEVYFQKSSNGVDWEPVNAARPVSYLGGASEVAFEFDVDGSAWFVTRNEDGDATGFGSHLCYAPPDDPSDWRCPSQSDPERYDSPEMFRHGEDVFLLARRDVGGPYDLGRDDLDLTNQRRVYALEYWSRPKRTALYKIDKVARKVVFVQDLPGTGDTAFASVKRLGPHQFLVANYTSPLELGDISWEEGQSSPRGTRIYLLELEFRPD